MQLGVKTSGEMSLSPSHPSLAAQAYDAIRDMLVTVRIPPGALVREGQLAEQLGVGRTPVREAIKRLEAERLLVIYPRRGIFATDANPVDLKLLNEVRMLLEGEAACRAAVRATNAQRRGLRQLLSEVAECGSGARQQIDFDTRAHRAIYQCANNAYLEATLTQYYNLGLRIWHLFLDDMQGVAEHVAELVPLLEAVIAADGERARRLALVHVSAFEQAVLSMI